MILDCDGVMFDSKEANRAYYDEILRRLGQRPVDPEELEFVHSSTAQEAVTFLLRRRGMPPDEGLRVAREVDYRPFIALMRPEPHLRELLSGLPPEVKKAISTNRTTTIGPLLEHFGLKDSFDLVVSAAQVKHPKPHPESLLLILEHFGANPQEALFVGDTSRDQEAARKAAIPFCSYRNPGLEGDFSVTDLLQVLEIIRSKRS